MSTKTLWRVFLPIFILAIPFTIYFAPEAAAFILGVIGFLAPLWLPALLVWVGWPLWLTFVRSHYVASIPYSTIELKPGPDTPKTARAMELVFYALYHRTEVTLVSEYLQGHIRVPWGFEILAKQGSVRLFVHLPTAHRQAMESRIRAEYRDIDIDEIQDHTREIAYDPYMMRLCMREYRLSKPDPYPLKTYLATESEKGKRNAFSEFLDQLALLGEGESLNISFIVRPHQRERVGFFSEEFVDSLHRDAQREIVSLLGPKGDVHAVSEDSRKTIQAIEQALKKPSFDCGVRALHIAPRTSSKEDAEALLENLFAPFNDPALNGFVPYNPKGKLGWALSELFGAVPAFMDLYFLQLYRRRAFFAPPYYGHAFVLNTEELATVFHIPSSLRAGSKRSGLRAEAPANLPV